MGLFSSKPCPICGGTTPKLLAKKVDGQAICSACANNIMADSDLVKKWSIEDLRTHIAARKENLKIVESFTPSRTIEYEHEVVIDDAKRLFYIKTFTEDNPPVFSFDDITGYTVELEYHTVESWSRGMVRTPYKPIEIGAFGTAVAVLDAFTSDDDGKDTKCTNIVVTLKLNTPVLREYELCDLLVDGRGQADYALSLSREMAKVNIICDLIIAIAT
ncbi:MAG: hypothetical protein RR573_06450 [Oscillospiraceae bacterium]